MTLHMSQYKTDRAHVTAVSLPLSPASIHSLYVVDFFVLTLCLSTIFLFIFCAGK